MLKNSYLKSVSTGYVRMMIQIGVAILLTPFILSYISHEEYGTYSLALGSIQFFSMFNFGFGGALGILVSRNTKNYSLVSSYSGIVQSFQLILGLVGLFSGIALSFNFNEFFDVVDKDNVALKTVVVIFSFSFFVTMLNQVYSTLLVANRQVALDNKIGIFTSLFGSLAVIIFLKLGLGIIGLSVSILITQVLNLVICFLRVKKSMPDLHISLFKFSLIDFKNMYVIGIWIFVGSISVFLIEKFDQFVVSKLLTLELVGVLVITSKLFELGKKIIFTISNNYRPYFGKLLEENKHDLANKHFLLLRHFTISIAIIFSSLLVVVNPYFIKLWVGKELYGGDYVSLFLGLNLVYHAWKLPNRAYLSSNLVVKEQSIFGIFEGLLNVVFSIFLGYRYGLVGIVAGTFLSGFILQIFFYGYLLNLKNLESTREYVKSQIRLFLNFILFYSLAYIFYLLNANVQELGVFLFRFFALVVVSTLIGLLLNIKRLKILRLHMADLG